ncbi:hypothetical protein KFL_002890010 [Klebsormidium nitens]|uniref:Replication origin-binding protein domain-containing protein n=1 Tax=Klebsormidium nitens TaxID=105231 RepID=A0A1Y1I650_KLENI|nr:hypothetical protein KFL_002890010 [Klebsormidium nitens]|eukprot:GAQ86434.1 hypothetical protein KFL_002890010 [Klebsormidium nitens]
MHPVQIPCALTATPTTAPLRRSQTAAMQLAATPSRTADLAQAAITTPPAAIAQNGWASARCRSGTPALVRGALQGLRGAGVHDEPSAAAAIRPTLDPSECERDEAQCAQRHAREGLCAPSNNLRPGRFPATSSRRTALSRSQGLTCTDRDAHIAPHAADSPPTTATASPCATGCSSKSECGLGAGRHQHAASLVSDGAQRGQRAEREGQCALSSQGSARVGAQSSRQPTATSSHRPVLVRNGLQGSAAFEGGSEKVFYSSAPKSRALIVTQMMIGGVESNPGWPTHGPDAPSSSSGRPLIPIPTADEVQESVRSKPVSIEPFDAWRASQSNPNWVAEVMDRSAVQPARPQWQDPPTAPSVSREETGPSSSDPRPASGPRSADTELASTRPLAVERGELFREVVEALAHIQGLDHLSLDLDWAIPVSRVRTRAPSSSPPHPTSQPLSTAAEPPAMEVAGRKRAASSRESFPAPSGIRIRFRSPDEAEVAATSDQEAASFDIEETSDETESDEEPTSEDDRGIDDSAVPDAERRDLYRQMEMEEAAARLEDETLDDALAPMRREIQRRKAHDEAPPATIHPMAREDLVAVPEPAVHSDPLTGNEVFKKDGFRVLRVREHGTNCFHQRGTNPRGRLPGPKHYMQQEAALLNHEAQVVLHKWSGMVSDGVRVPWRSFIPGLGVSAAASGGARVGDRNYPERKPCKPYLDLDWKEGLPFRRQPVIGADGEVVEAREKYGREEVIGLMEKWASIVFKEQYDCELQPSSFVWIESPRRTKFSLHLTINQLSPRQLVFASNTEGALHFARRLKKRLQRWHPALADAIDLNVYSKDRQWRTPGSAKIEKPESVLTCINPAHSWKDALVTWLEPLEAREEVKLPFEVPERLHESRNTEGGDSDVPCVSRAYCLGDLFEDNISYETGAVKVDMEHLKRVPGASTPELVAEVAAGLRKPDDLMKLNTVANEWIEGKFPLLGIRSGVNTGKTVFCGAVGDELWRASDHPITTIMITYRVAQAEDLKRRFPRTANYLDLKADYENQWFQDPNDKHNLLTALQSRKDFPEIVVQVDSLLNLRPGGIGEVAPFDLVILDEVASILAHLSAATLRNGMETSELFLEIVQRAKRVLAMDDGYGQREHDFFRLAKVPGKLVINTRRAAVPLTFRIGLDEKKWLDRIVADLAAGKNVVVVSMSAKVLDRIRDQVMSRHSLGLADTDILIHKALSGGETTALLRNVAENWKVRLLMYSPTVEAGVNFDVSWFHTKFLYMCKKSTTARAAWQATLRVRKTESALVHCFVQSSISVMLDCAQEVPAARLCSRRQEGTTAMAPHASDAADESTLQDDDGGRLDQQVAVDSPLNGASGSQSGVGGSSGQHSERLKGLFGPPRRVTTAETLQYLQACNSEVTAAWRRVPSRTEDPGKVVRLIEDGPLFRTFAHTEAERRNSDVRLLHEFQVQVARAGHVVEVEQTEELSKKSKRRKGLDAEALKIIGARVIDEEEYEELRKLRDTKRDRGAQSVEVMRYEACQYYGLKDLDEHFFKETKAEYKPPFSKKLDLLLKVLLPGRFLDEGAVARQSHVPKMAETARGLLKDLGLAHPFDVGGETRSLLAGGLKDRLLNSELFRGRPKRVGAKSAMSERAVSEMFQIQLPAPKEGKAGLDPGQLKGVMNRVLEHMGLKLGKAIEVSRPRRGKGKQNESASGNSDYRYKLERKHVLRMAKLVKLQFREVPRVWQHRRELEPAVRGFLNEVDASDLDHLLRRPSGHPLLEELRSSTSEEDLEECMIVLR